ncbi:MAG: universal stress protein [Bacteroidetes bacterium]|nr:universal stress protein [Bacteroidota bacterium]
MKTILLPTDFSETARNAAIYAIHLGNQLKAAKMILYNACEEPMPTELNMGPINFIGVEATINASKEALKKFENGVISECPTEMAIELKSEYTTLSNDINELCTSLGADLIVMGVTGGGKLQETLVGSNAVHVARHSETPVIIIPPGAAWSPIQEVVLACDFKKVVDTMPVEPIRNILDVTKAGLFILNIDHRQKNFSVDTPFESLMLNEFFHTYNPQYTFSDNEDFIEGINAFALEKKVDLIITIPKKHGLFDKLFSNNHTKKLAFHSHVPLMMIHENDE